MTAYSKLPEVLLSLAGESRGGVFRAQNASLKKQLILKNGTISFAESSQPDEHLARIMVSMGFLKQSDLREIISRMKSGKNVEEAIAALDRSGEESIHKGLQEQVIVVLSSLLAWRNVDMRFFPGEDLIKNRSHLGLNIPGMLVSAARRAVAKRLVTAPAGFLDGTVAVDPATADKRMVFPLNETESFAYIRAQDEIPARELLSLLSCRDETAPEEVFLRLYALGLIEPKIHPGIPSSDITESGANDTIEMVIEEMLLRFQNAGLYEILSIEPDAGPDEIQAAYHDMAKRYHPDRFQSAKYSDDLRHQVEQVFSYVNKAYRTLRDTDLRSLYDKERLSRDSKVAAAIKSKKSAGTDEEEMIEALFRHGCRSLKNEEFEKAVKELKSCVYLRPDNAGYNYYLGLAESEVPGMYKVAEQHLLKAVKLESIPSNSLVALVKLYIKVCLPRKAAAMHKELMRWDPDHPEAQKLLEEIEGYVPA